MSNEVAVDYVNDFVKWYNSHSQTNRWAYLTMKAVQIVLAAAIPILTPLEISRQAIAVMGGTIGILEGIIQLGQFHQSWIRYRSTCEALRSELFLYRTRAGPYSQASDPHALLAERSNSLVSAENSRWQAMRETTTTKEKA
jgi:Protein of unknown function (DUF4231)